MRKLYISVVIALSLAVIASPASARTPNIGGTWNGIYFCGESMPLTLRIQQSQGDLEATFSFTTSDGTAGSFSMTGEIDGNGYFALDGSEWINQPSGFVMVGLNGQYDPDRSGSLNGNVEGPMCNSFVLHR